MTWKPGTSDHLTATGVAVPPFDGWIRHQLAAHYQNQVMGELMGERQAG
jgi:hypothetical protein